MAEHGEAGAGRAGERAAGPRVVQLRESNPGRARGSFPDFASPSIHATAADAPRPAGETLIAELYGLDSVVLKGVLSRGGVSILSHGVSDLLALRRRWTIRQVLSKRIAWHEQNSGCEKQELSHGSSPLMTGHVRGAVFWLPHQHKREQRCFCSIARKAIASRGLAQRVGWAERSEAHRLD